jgi:hypothetical protein
MGAPGGDSFLGLLSAGISFDQKRFARDIGLFKPKVRLAYVVPWHCTMRAASHACRVAHMPRRRQPYGDAQASGAAKAVQAAAAAAAAGGGAGGASAAGGKKRRASEPAAEAPALSGAQRKRAKKHAAAARSAAAGAPLLCARRAVRCRRGAR